MKLFFIVCSFFFAINMMAQEPMQEVVGLETKSVSQIPGVILKFFNEVQSSGHIEFVARVLDENNQSMEPQGAYTYSWSITGSPLARRHIFGLVRQDKEVLLMLVSIILLQEGRK